MARWRDYVEPSEGTSIADRPEPEKDVPPALGVIFGSQLGWSRDREGQPLGGCTLCGNGEAHTPITSGSRIVCAGCLRYGLDSRVKALLAATPAKPRARPCTTTPRPGKDRRCSSSSAKRASGSRSPTGPAT